MKHLATALTNIRRSPYQTLAVLLLVTITFFVGYVFSLFLYGTEHILKHFESTPQVTAFFKIESPESAVSNLETIMKSKPYVNNVTVISKQHALEIFKEDNKQDPLLLELVTADILPASIEVSSKDAESLPEIRKDLQTDTNIDEVVYQEDVIKQLQAWTKSIRTIGVASIVVLGLTSLLWITIITSLKVVNRRRTIQIMRVIGASKWYVRAPFIYEGIIYGAVGSLTGWAVMFLSVLYATPWLSGFLGTIALFPLPVEFYAIQLAIGTGVGVVLGALASAFSTQRMMRNP